jgi:hypothetical protein
MTLSSIWQNIVSALTPKAAPTKTLDEFFQFMAGFPYAQVAAAALAEGTNVPLDITAGAALASDIAKAFFSAQSTQMATIAVATKMGISPAVSARIVFAPDPVHPSDPTQFSKGH